MDIYYYLWIFIIYSVIGWIAEEVVFALWWSPAKIVNRGFLNGPYCPIYGFGALFITFLLTPLKWSFVLVFLASAVLASALELITGLILDKWFHHKWWDYYNYPFNFKGYICLKSAIMWGACGLILMYVLQPVVNGIIVHTPKSIGLVLLLAFIVSIVADLVVTILTLRGVARKYKILDQIVAQINDSSEHLSKNIYDQTHEAVKIGEESAKNIEKLRLDYREMMNKKVFGYERIMKAFPGLSKGMTRRNKSDDNFNKK